MDSTAKEKLLLPDSGKEEEEEELWKRLWAESKKVWVVAIPACFTRISMFGVFIISQVFMGLIGNTELAALSVVFHLLARFSIGILMGMSSGLETLCGQAYGAKQYQMLGIYLQRSWVVESGFFLLLILPVFIFSAPILKLLGQTEEISHMTNIISLWYIPIMISYIFLYTLQMYLQAQSKNILITWLSAITIIFHGFCTWILVQKTRLGFAGVMISINIASWIPIVGQLIFVFYGGCPQTWTGFSMHALSDLWPVFKLSLSSGVMLCLELWYSSILILFTGNTKNAEVTIDALSICLNINGLEMMLSFGFLAAARDQKGTKLFLYENSVRVSNELGRGNAKAAKFAVKVVLVTSMLVEVVLWASVLVFRNKVSSIFSSSMECLLYVLSKENRTSYSKFTFSNIFQSIK
ncbi:protein DETOXIFICATION 21-like [Telopea speciosissima]|uniref:protein DETOXIFICATION 21-like n=1 Tax=Telopea speciosissima TaxID=54955 RepID=UPI001CC40B0E|nr:protein DETOXIFICATION 21-like [Telopea speciosissima]